MAWSTPISYTTGQVVSAANMNTSAGRDNEQYLKDQFATTTGHRHDGATDSGAPPLLAIEVWGRPR